MGYHLSTPRTEQQLLDYILDRKTVPLQRLIEWNIDLIDFTPFAHYKGYTVLQSLKLSKNGDPYFAIELIRFKMYELDKHGDKLAPCRIPIKLFENSIDELVCLHYKQCCNYKVGKCKIGDETINRIERKMDRVYIGINLRQNIFKSYSDSMEEYYTANIEGT
jgi:hypothetical protein